MTIERAIGRGAVRFVAALVGVALVWFAGLAVFTVVFEPPTFVIFFGPPSAVLSAVSQHDMRIVSGGRGFLVVADGGAGYVRSLYRSGAWLVLPTARDGCGLTDVLSKRQRLDSVPL